MRFEWIWNGCDHGGKCMVVYFINHSRTRTIFFSQINSRELVREQKNMTCQVFYVAREVKSMAYEIESMACEVFYVAREIKSMACHLKSMAREVFSVAWNGMNCVEERNLYIYAR